MIFNRFKKEAFMEKVDFEVKLVHENPVDLIQMANSLISLQNIISSHIGKEHGIKECKIYLQGVKEGSDIYKLALDFGVAVLPLVQGANAFIETLELISSYKDIKNKTLEEIKNNNNYSISNCNDIKNLVAPIINNDDNAKIEIIVKGDVNAPITIINSKDAKRMYENAEEIKNINFDKREAIQNNKFFQNVLIKMHKTTDSLKLVKDSAYCDDIVKNKAISTIFINKEDKEEVLQNPFQNLFLVDIEVNRIDDEIKLYKVTKLKKIIPYNI